MSENSADGNPIVCPWCGGTPSPINVDGLQNDVVGKQVVCLTVGCEARGPVADTRESAVLAWNGMVEGKAPADHSLFDWFLFPLAIFGLAVVTGGSGYIAIGSLWIVHLLVFRRGL